MGDVLTDAPDSPTRAAAEAVARQSYGKLVAFLASRSRDVAAAEDALSEAFASALNDWPRHGVPDKPEAWLLTVARREYIGFRRAQALDISRVLLLGLVPRTNAGEPEADLALSAALARLADADREVLLLGVSGLEPEAMADALGVTSAAFRQRLSRARRRLAALLDADGTSEQAATKGAR